MMTNETVTVWGWKITDRPDRSDDYAVVNEILACPVWRPVAEARFERFGHTEEVARQLIDEYKNQEGAA